MLGRNILARPAPTVILLVLVSLLLYWPTVVSLYQVWTNPSNPTYSHGLLLVAISAVLLYRQWKRAPIEPDPSMWGFLALAAVSFVWLLAHLGQIQIVQQLSLLAVMGLLLWAVLGYRNAKRLAFPVLLLVFAMPFWEFLSVRLQYLTADVVTFLLNNTGFTAILDDTFIIVPAGSFEVSTDCSGLAQFIVAMVVAALYSHLNELAFRNTLFLTAVAMLVSIITNILRIYIVVVAGQLTAMQHPFVKHHWNLGWVLFGIGILVFLLWANRYVATKSKGFTKPEQNHLSPGALNNPGLVSTTVSLRTVAFSLGALALGPVLGQVYAGQAAPTVPSHLAVPARIGSWQAIDAGPDHYRPYFHGADVEYDTLYRPADGANVYLYVGYYAHQEQGKEAVYYLNKVYDGDDWRRVGERQISVGSSERVRVKETRIQSKKGGTKIVWQWYYTNGSRTSNDYVAKMLNVIGILRHHPGIAVIVVATDVNESIETARSQLMRFVADALQEVERGIDATEST